MNANEYQQGALRTMIPDEEQAEKLILALARSPHLTQIMVAGMKLSSEAGELNDAIVKHISYGQPLDIENIIEECGDLLWYISVILESCNMTMGECMAMNINKLKIRYPENFTEKDAAERKDKLVDGEKPCGCYPNEICDRCHPPEGELPEISYEQDSHISDRERI